MFKRKLTIPDFFLIVVNLVPLYGVWFEGWDAKQVFIVYCLETVIIGIINVVKMTCINIFGDKQLVEKESIAGNIKGRWFVIIFFIFHYGFFVFVQTQIFFAVSGLKPGGSLMMSYSNIPALLGNNGKLLLLIFITYYTAQSIFGFFTSGDYKTASLSTQMFEPYVRIFVQQLVVILGSMFLTFGATRIFILIFVLVKIFFELFINAKGLIAMAEKKALAEKEKRKLKSPQ
jgi:hypothetical protein